MYRNPLKNYVEWKMEDLVKIFVPKEKKFESTTFR